VNCEETDVLFAWKGVVNAREILVSDLQEAGIQYICCVLGLDEPSQYLESHNSAMLRTQAHNSAMLRTQAHNSVIRVNDI
jgi:hypothetical protein